MQGNKLNIIDEFQLYIPVSLASKYSEISIEKLSKYIQKGYIPHRNGEFPEGSSSEEIEHLSDTILIPLSELRPEAIKSYILDNIGTENYFNADFLGFEQKYGKTRLEELLNDIRIIKEIATYRQTHFSESIGSLSDSIFKKYSLSSTRYYEEVDSLKSLSFCRGLFKKQIGLAKQQNFTSLCPLARDFIMNRLFRFNNSDTDPLFEDLKKEAEFQGVEICSHCPHNPLSSCYDIALAEIEAKYPTQTLCICEQAGKGLITPTSRATIQRFKNSIPNSTLYFAQSDYKQWEARYAYKLTRTLPEKVNDIGCSDHTELDILLLFGYTPDGEPIIRHPWGTIQIDIASGVPTGSILSFRPDNETIGQCFARASAITVNTPEIHGTCKVLLVDRGRDYRSGYICEKSPNYPNRAIFENGLMPVLGCKVMHCGRKSPWVKPVERFNLTISKMLRRYPGYTGGKRKRRFIHCAEQEIQRLLKAGRIMTIEQFSMYWYNEIIPAICNHSVRGKPSPMEKYRSLPKADTLTPEWSTLSVFLKKKHKAKVNCCKIFHNKYKYRSPLLDAYHNQEVLIYTLDQNYTDSVFVVKGSQFICEAFREEKIDFIEDNQYKLQKARTYRHLQQRKISQGIEVVRYLTEVSKLNHRHYIDEDIVYTVGEEFAPGGIPISDGALAAAKAELEAKCREIEQYQTQKKHMIAELTSVLSQIYSQNSD